MYPTNVKLKNKTSFYISEQVCNWQRTKNFTWMVYFKDLLQKYFYIFFISSIFFNRVDKLFSPREPPIQYWWDWTLLWVLWESLWRILRKLKILRKPSSVWPSYSTLWNISKGLDILLHRYLLNCVCHHSVLHS